MATLLVAAAGLFASFSPRDSEKPLVTVYMRSDCGTCRRWMDHLAARGFRTRIGSETEWPNIRARFRLPPGLRGAHTAVVENLLIEGHVPARDIHQVLQQRDQSRIEGLVVPGLPGGAPGVDSRFPQPYVVYAMYDAGLLRPLVAYENGAHF